MLKPLDLQTVMPRSVDLQRLQQVDQARPIAEQQEMSRETIRQTQLKQEQVQTNEASQNSNQIHDEEKRRNRGRHYRRYKDGREEPEKEEETTKQAVDSKRGQHIDFKI
jgi:hypothetical protein